MRERMRSILLALCVVLTLLPGTARAEEKDLVDIDTLVLEIGGNEMCTVSINPTEGCTYAVESKDPDVAFVGVVDLDEMTFIVSAVAAGTTTIVVTAKREDAVEQTGEIVVKVTEKSPAPTLHIASDTADIKAGGASAALLFYVENAAFRDQQSAEYWAVNPGSGLMISSVKLDGNNALVVLVPDSAHNGLPAGTVTITAKKDAFIDAQIPETGLACELTIAEASDARPIAPPVLAVDPASAAAGTEVLEVTLSADREFSEEALAAAAHAGIGACFTIDAGTTGFELVGSGIPAGVAADQTPIKLTFSAAGGARAGSLTIAAKSTAFSGLDAGVVIEPITITVIASQANTPEFSPAINGGGGTIIVPPLNDPDVSWEKTTAISADGTVTEAAISSNGSETMVETRPDGSSVTTVKYASGSSTTTVSVSGRVTAEVTLAAPVVAAAQSGGHAVALPVPAVPLSTDAASAPSVTVNTGSSEPVKVEIPVARTTPGTVAIVVKDDGTEEVVRTSLATANGVTLAVADGTTVKIVDNSRSFADTANHWAADAVAFVTAHELFSGTSETTFMPEDTMTRAMLVTVLARYDGVETEGGSIWYAKGADWAVTNNIFSGDDLEAPVGREQLAVMLYRYASGTGLDVSASDTLTGFSDTDSVSTYALRAMSWAVGAGIIGGTDKGELNPGGSATRAEVATMLMRFCEYAAG